MALFSRLKKIFADAPADPPVEEAAAPAPEAEPAEQQERETSPEAAAAGPAAETDQPDPTPDQTLPRSAPEREAIAAPQDQSAAPQEPALSAEAASPASASAPEPEEAPFAFAESARSSRSELPPDATDAGVPATAPERGRAETTAAEPGEQEVRSAAKTPQASEPVPAESGQTGADAALPVEGAEDAETESESFFTWLFRNLARTRKRLAARLKALFGGNKIDDAFWEELEEILISADVGMDATMALIKNLKTRLRQEGVLEPSEVPPYLQEELAAVFAPAPAPVEARPEIVLVIGVNGVGKTTTIAKLAYQAKNQGRTVLIAAADTFRAAAVEQLQTWAKRVGCVCHAKGQNADPAAVAYEAVEAAQRENADIVFVDTAGRLHTKTNLMEELLKIRRVLGKRLPGAPHRTILVMDATTGQNGLSQARLFSEACGIDELVLTKLDGTAKGGIAVAIAMQFGIPITYVGLGEGMRDLRPFEPVTFARVLLNTKE